MLLATGLNKMNTKLLTIALILFALISTSCGERIQAWIVLTFTLPDGQSAQMAFNNPDDSNISKSQCEELLPKAVDSLLQTAFRKEPRLRDAKFNGAHCVLSTSDPVKPTEGT
jgi:hypothetical protein